MNLKNRIQITESFIHLRNSNSFINTKYIEQLDYSLDEKGKIYRVTIYINSNEAVTTVENPEDIATIASYFFGSADKAAVEIPANQP